MNNRALTLGFAIAITVTSVFMAAVAAQDRGGALTDQILLVALSVSVTLLVHFLPSITRNKLVLIVWGLCLVAALFNHLNFFVHSAERADATRGIKAEDSIKVRALFERIADVSREYSSIDTRTETDITQRLVTATGWKVRSALNIELAEARRKIVLSNQLAELKSKLANYRETAGSDAVTSEISRVAGVSPVTINVSIGLLLALLVELSGAILWYEILHGRAAKSNSVSVSENQELSHQTNLDHIAVESPAGSSGLVKPETALLSGNEDINEIIVAINKGKCQATAASIRTLLRCRTSRAAKLNRLVKEVMQAQQQGVSIDRFDRKALA